jgi:hypothetical protein
VLSNRARLATGASDLFREIPGLCCQSRSTGRAGAFFQFPAPIAVDPAGLVCRMAPRERVVSALAAKSPGSRVPGNSAIRSYALGRYRLPGSQI